MYNWKNIALKHLAYLARQNSSTFKKYIHTYFKFVLNHMHFPTSCMKCFEKIT